MQNSLSARRLRLVLWAVLVWVVLILARLVQLQVFKHAELAHDAQVQQQKTSKVQAMRGAILDRAGQPLAKSLPAETLVVNPKQIQDPSVTSALLANVLNLDQRDLNDQIRASAARGKGYLRVARKLTEQEAERVSAFRLPGVGFEPDMIRLYPHGQLAAHVLGSVGFIDDDTERGTAGVEMAFNEDLAGRPGEARQLFDGRQDAYDSLMVREPEPGADLTLTIDQNMQFQAERALQKAMESSHARTGSIIVMDPHTGDILAMASYPTYNPNPGSGEKELPDARSNLAITTPFEPGSVFKVFTLSAALETTRLRPDSIINCGNGSINLYGRLIHDHDRYSSLSMADVLAKSSNVGAINIGREVGEKNLYDYDTRFGFGKKTGIELPGESAGVLRRVKYWTPSSIGSIAMGHEVTATSLQLALAGSAVANGGLLPKPRLVMARQRPGQAKEFFQPERPERIMQAETAIKMRQMMEGVVLHGTGKRAILKGYTSGGKTGSAQIYDLKAHLYTHSYNSSFLGFAPVVNPQLVIEVTLNGTTGGSAGYGGAVAAPVFHDVAMEALRMLDVPKDLPTVDEPVISRGRSNENDLAVAGLAEPPAELFSRPVDTALNFARPDSRVRSVSSVTPPPLPGGASPSDEDVSRDRRHFLSQKKAPDFRGMTPRAVREKSTAAGLKVEVRGSGRARSQDPPPGATVPPDAVVRVQFRK